MSRQMLIVCDNRAIDMAIEFPHCDVVGVDLVPPRIQGYVLPSLRTVTAHGTLREPPANCRYDWQFCFN